MIDTYHNRAISYPPAFSPAFKVAYAISGIGDTVLNKITVAFAGQSNMEYPVLRGTPRAVTYFCEELRDELGFTGGAFTLHTAAEPKVCTDASTKTGSDFTTRVVNGASGGSSLTGLTSAGVPNSEVAAENYWYNQEDFSSLTGNPADTAGTAGPLLRDLVGYIGTYGADCAMWHQGETDLSYVALGSTERANYKAALLFVIDALRDAAGKPNMPFFFGHFGRGNRASNAGFQIISEIQQEIAEENANVYIGTEYYPEIYARVETVSVTTTSGSSTVASADITDSDRNKRISGTGIPDYSYIGSVVVDNVSFVLRDGAGNTVNATASGTITAVIDDDTHHYPGADGVQPLDTDGNTTHNTEEGYYSILKRACKPIKDVVKDRVTNKKYWGPKVSTVSAAVGIAEIYLAVTHDEGTTLATKAGSALNANCKQFFRVENNGSPMTITDVSLQTDSTIKITTSGTVSVGTLEVWMGYQAMNRTDDREFIFDNATLRRPLAKDSPDVNPALSIVPGDSVPINTVQPILYGPASVGETLFVTTGTWVGSASFTYSYQWKRNGTNVGTDSASHSTAGYSNGDIVTCIVTAINGEGSTPQTSQNPATLAARNASLQTIVAECEFDLDATIATSHNGIDKVWRNLCPAPYSGTTIDQHNFNAGTSSASSTDDPTFTGTVGDSAAYFLLDGGDNWSLEDLSNPAFWQNLHKTTGASAGTLVVTLQTAGTMSTLQALMATASSATDHGIRLEMTSTNRLAISQVDGTTQSTTSTTATLSTSTIYALGVAFDFSGTSASLWINSATSESKTLTKGTTTTNASFAARLAARGTTSNRPLNGTCIYSMAGFAKMLSDSEFDSVVTQLETRHGRVYIP